MTAEELMALLDTMPMDAADRVVGAIDYEEGWVSDDDVVTLARWMQHAAAVMNGVAAP